MIKHNSRIPFVLIFLILATLACGLPNSTDSTPQIPDDSPAGPIPNSTATEPPIQHLVFPDSLPEFSSDHAGDYDSSVTADQKKSNGGDRFSFERFERPFNANTMDTYFPELDIVDTNVYQDDTWVFGTIQVKDRSAANTSPYRFAMQVDTDVNGKGNFIVLASNPTSTDWDTAGVQVYSDTNGDVGDLSAMFTDEGSTSDGFETMIFDQGQGDDPDVAWVRVSPQDPNTVEIAVKRSVLGNSQRYLVDMWTGHALLDPALFDYSDHFTHEQAGAADPGFPIYYPIKSVYELDNSCRLAVGFQPLGNEPGLCPVPYQPQPGEPGSCTATRIQIYFCISNNGTWNSSTCTCTPPTPIPPPK